MHKYEEIIKPLMSEKRYKHSLNVSKKAEELAEKYGADKKKAKIAGILHDITKERTPEEQWEIVEKYNLFATDFEKSIVKLLHSKTGSAYIENVLGINDGDILNAVKYHTTGRGGMSRLEKVLFVADFISEDRDYDGVEDIRKLEKKGLDRAFLGGLVYVINSLVKDSKPIHPDTVEAYNEAAFKKEKENL